MSRADDARAQAGLPPRPTPWFWRAALVVLVAAVVWSYWGLEFKWGRLIDAPVDTARIAQAMVANFDPSKFGKAAQQMVESVTMAWLGTMIAAVVALPLAFLAAENLVAKPVAVLARQVLNILRAVPEVILALVFLPTFGLNPTTGVVAIGVGSIGTLGKLYYEVIEGTYRGPIEGVDAVGANAAQRLRWGVVPQVAPELASLAMYRFEVNIRASAVLGLLSAGGIGEMVSTAFEFKQYGEAAVGMTVMIGATIAIDFVSSWIRRRIIAGPGVDVGTSTPESTEHQSNGTHPRHASIIQ